LIVILSPKLLNPLISNLLSCIYLLFLYMLKLKAQSSFGRNSLLSFAFAFGFDLSALSSNKYFSF